MEPLTTLMLVCAILAPIPLTNRPEWATPVNSKIKSALIDPDVHTTFYEPTTEFSSATDSILMRAPPNIFVDRRDLLASEVKAYNFLTVGWDGSESVPPSMSSMDSALTFIKKLPGGLPLPRPMISSIGEVGFYWDMDGGFADISFTNDGKASFFSRSTIGIEEFNEDMLIQAFTRDWFFSALGELSSPQTLAA